MKFNLINSLKYRNDIDGLRAIAVLVVIFFHFGYLSNGYLGVDVFFVISGYLITGIIHNKILQNNFSVKDFYIRRAKRILPLVSFVTLVSLTLGFFFMLPDDLENLAQSVIATNFFNNNTLQILTTKNYWDVVNEFKPLMHTWSLAIEEQFYFFYPFIFILINKTRFLYKRTLLVVLIGLTLVSILLYLSSFEQYYKFYLLPFRFFELSLGGLVAIVSNTKVVKFKTPYVFIIILVSVMCFNFNFLNDDLLIILTVILTSLILLSDNHNNGVSKIILENKIIVFLGKISFSLYMWHQIVLAFYRYIFIQEIHIYNYIIIFIVTLLLSILSYFFIENYFRYKMKTNIVILSLLTVFLITNILSLDIYNKSGIVRDVEELDLTTDNRSSNIHSQYNDRIYNYDNDFISKDKIKILVLGNSFARDWANVLIESKYFEQIEISYIYDPSNHPNITNRSNQADFIFISSINKPLFDKFLITNPNVWCVGTKNFGINMGVFYNYSGSNYCLQKTPIKSNHLKTNTLQKKQWGSDHYIDLIEALIDENMKMPVFTPDCKFISHDSRHLTQSGAKYVASIIKNQLTFLDFAND